MEEFFTSPWTIGIGTTVIAGVILYFVFGIGRQKNQKNEENNRVQVHADIARSRNYTLLEILNTGTENIINLQCTIRWNQKEGPQERRLYGFFGEGENPITMTAREIRTLRTGERIYADSIPLYSVDGRINVSINGEGATSHSPLEYSTVVENEAREN